MESLNFELPVGLDIRGEVHKTVELLETNGIAERVFVKKLPEKPYTWQGNVVAIATKSIGGINIGVECREGYLKNETVVIPESVLALTLADVNTLLVEIHRRCWESILPKQEVLCKYCHKRLETEINLDRIDFLPDTKEKLNNPLFNYREIIVDLNKGFTPKEIPGLTDREEYVGLTERVFNRIILRPPTLKDGIKHEAYVSDSIGFWRRIAADCLLSFECVVDGKVVETLPELLLKSYGLKIFNEYLMGKDLKLIRTELIEYLPTLPFAYYDTCGCELQKEIPVAMEATNFFSE